MVRSYGAVAGPGLPGTRNIPGQVIMDVVHRYDMDGVHFDDYSLPTRNRQAGGNLDLPDDSTWAAYRGQGGGARSVGGGDINKFVHEVYRAIKGVKPWVKFGISSFGIWRASHPAQTPGSTPTTNFIATRASGWRKGWLDYRAPQLYWPVNDEPHTFPVLLQWWEPKTGSIATSRPGLKVDGSKERRRSRAGTEAEIALTRQQAGASGRWPTMPGRSSRPRAAARGTSTPPPTTAAAPPLGPRWEGNPPSQPRLKAAKTHGNRLK